MGLLQNMDIPASKQVSYLTTKHLKVFPRDVQLYRIQNILKVLHVFVKIVWTFIIDTMSSFYLNDSSFNTSTPFTSLKKSTNVVGSVPEEIPEDFKLLEISKSVMGKQNDLLTFYHQ